MAKTSTTILVVVSVMTLCLCGSLGYRYDDDEEGELSNKEIKETLKMLTNEVKELKEGMKEIKTQLGQQGASQVSQRGSPEKQMTKNISVLSASRKFLANGKVCFTVRYKMSGKSQTLNYWGIFKDFSSETIPGTSVCNQTPSNSLPHVHQTSANVTPQNNSYVKVAIGTSTEWATLYFQNVLEGDENQTDVELPLMEVSPSPEFVYQPGHNISIKLGVPTKIERTNPGDQIYVDNYRADYKLTLPGRTSLISNINSDTSIDDMFQESKTEKFLDKIQFEAVLNTAEYPVMGLMTLTTGYKHPTHLVAAAEYSRIIPLHPSTQSTAFAKGQLFALKYDWLNKNEDGELETSCSYGKSCQVYCEVYGDDVTDLKLYKTVNGVTRTVPITTFGSSQWRTGHHEVSTDPGTPSQATYTCEGSNSQGRVVTWSQSVIVGERAKILRDQTHFELLDNKTAMITCTARGTPRPDVSILCDYEKPGESDVIYRSNDVIIVFGKCHDVQPYNSGISCDATNKLNTDVVNFSNNNSTYSF